MEYIIGLIFGIPLFVLALLLFSGKCVSLLSGFHTSKQQEGYNAKKVGRFTGAFLLVMSVFVFFIPSKNTAISVASMVLIVVLSVILIVLVNTLKYFKT